MNTRLEWLTNANGESDEFYTAEETLNNVIENFNIRRNYSNEGKEIIINDVTEKCLVQTSSNPLNELDDQRKIYCPLSMTINRGDYVTYENSIWIIKTNVVNIDGAYQSARMSMCSYLLKWQDSSGNIIERWCITESNENKGVDDNKIVQLGNSQLKVILPYDSETIKIRKDKRFYIDSNTENPIPYIVTNSSTTDNVYNGHGYLTFVVSEQVTVSEKDRPDLMLCDYITPSTPTPPDETIVSMFKSSITYTSATIKSGSKRTFAAVFKDESGNVVNTLTPKWTIDSTFTDKLKVTYGTNNIVISINDDSLIGSNFKLKLEAMDDSASVSEITIDIISLY